MHIYLVLKIQFSSRQFSGSESSGVVLLNIVMSGGTTDEVISMSINLNGISATGSLLQCSSW